MRVEHREGMVLVIGGLVPPGADAITIGHFVFVRPAAVGDRRLLRHERVHVQQWAELGAVRFLTCYLGAYLRWRLRRYPHKAAYRRIPLEIRAEWSARRPVPTPARDH